MPSRGRKRKPETDAGGDAHSAAAPSPRASKKQPIRKEVLKPLREYAADGGRNDAKSFLKSAATAKKKRSTAASAKKEVRRKADEVLALINQPSRASSGLDKDTLRELREAHAVALTGVSKGNALNCTPSHSANIPDASNHVIQRCLSSAAAYNTASKRRTDIKLPEWMRWNQDIRDLRALNKHAFELVVKIVDKSILGVITGKMETLKLTQGAGDLERLAWEMLEEVMPRKSEATWGTVANAQLKALIALGEALETQGEDYSRR